MRILGIDYGEKRIGIALSDPSETIAQGKGVYEWRDKVQLIGYIKESIKKYSVDMIVVGLPYNMDGTLGKKANEVMEFIEELKRNIDISISTWDERLTTLQSDRILIEADVSRKKRKKSANKMAATLILQGFLDSRHKDENS